jgi:hypothetical protein
MTSRAASYAALVVLARLSVSDVEPWEGAGRESVMASA